MGTVAGTRRNYQKDMEIWGILLIYVTIVVRDISISL